MLQSERRGEERRTANTKRYQLPEQDRQETDSRQTGRPGRVPAQHRQAQNLFEHRCRAAGESHSSRWATLWVTCMHACMPEMLNPILWCCELRSAVSQLSQAGIECFVLHSKVEKWRLISTCDRWGVCVSTAVMIGSRFTCCEPSTDALASSASCPWWTVRPQGGSSLQRCFDFR